MALPAVQYTSVEDYLLLEESAPEKHEYVSGTIVAMAGATEEHNRIVANLLREVGGYLKGKGCGMFPSDFRVTTPAGKSYFYPDASVVCGPTQKQPGIFDTLLNPTVIIEVISEGTEKIDRGYKFFYYQQIPTLQEYVLIDSRSYTVDVIRRQTDGAWKFDKYTGNQIHLASINCTLSFADLYFDVKLPSSE